MICKKCSIEKELTNFPKGRRVCKKCLSIMSMLWAQENKEKVLENSRKHREENREKLRKRCLDFYHRNPWKNKRYREENPEKQKEYQKRYREKNVEEIRKRRNELRKEKKIHNTIEVKARKAVFMAIKKGCLVRANNCQMCNKECKPEAHHGDYNRPLEVIWVCKPCHGTIHMALNRNNEVM